MTRSNITQVWLTCPLRKPCLNICKYSIGRMKIAKKVKLRKKSKKNEYM